MKKNLSQWSQILLVSITTFLTVGCVASPQEQLKSSTSDDVAVAKFINVSSVDEASQHPNLAAWRALLLAAIVARDVPTISHMSSPEIELEIGGTGGRVDLTERLTGVTFPKTSTQFDNYWYGLEKAVASGGTFNNFNALETFHTPVYGDTWAPAGWDAYNILFIRDDAQSIFAGPSETEMVLTTLKNVAVQTMPEVDQTGEGRQNPFARVIMTNGEIGYLKRSGLLGIGDYSATFEKVDGQWQMKSFYSGL